MVSRRFLDRPAAQDWLRTTGEFVVRDHGPGRLWAVVGVLTMVTVVVALADVAVGAAILDTRLRVVVALLLAGFVLRTLFVVSGRLRLLELRVLLLASALKTRTSWFAVVRSSGAVVDCDQGFVDRFGPAESIDGLLDLPGLEAGARDRLWTALGQRHAVTFEVELPEGDDSAMVARLTPLARPSGYFLLCGEAPSQRGPVTAE